MSSKEKNKILTWFSQKVRVVGMHPQSFEERWRIVVSRVQLVSIFLVFLLFFFGLFYALLFYTPLSYLLPNDFSKQSRNELLEHHNQVRKYEKVIAQQQQFIENFQQVILGEMDIDSVYMLKEDERTALPELDTNLQRAEILLSDQIERREEEQSKEGKKMLRDLFLLDPVEGEMSQNFHPERHLGVDVVTKKDASVFACLEGVIVHSGYEDKDGWTVIIQHPNEIISAYKHLKSVMKNAGDFVKTGEIIGVVGNSGERSTGPHLHFEIWSPNGSLNPNDYLSFGK